MKFLQQKITLYKNVFDKTGTETTVQEALNQIQQAAALLKLQIKNIRGEKDKDKKGKLKQELPAVTFSGSFEKRSKDKLTTYSHIYCVDIDKLDIPRLLDLKTQLQDNSRVLAVFISPSGNGLKILIPTETTADEHEAIFPMLQFWFKDLYDVEIDIACKDVSRLCFLSDDDTIYINPNAIPINKSWITTQEMPTQTANEVQDIDSRLNEVRNFTDKKKQYYDGNRNEYIHLFANNCNRKGITQDECLYYCFNNFNDSPQTEITRTVKSAYKHTEEHAKYENKKSSKNKKGKHKDNDLDVGTGDKFWKQSTRTNKSTGETYNQYTFVYRYAIAFLTKRGFYKFKVGDKYELIHVQDNVIEMISETYIKEYLLEFLKTDINDEKIQVYEMYMRGARTYISNTLFLSLHYFNPTLRRDTRNTAFVYFKDNYLEVSKNGVEVKKYSEMKGYIWKKQIIDFNLNYTEDFDCDFTRFLEYAITGINRYATGEDYIETETKKVLSISTTIGYLLHRYKNPALTKAIVAVDKTIRKNSYEPNGRSGKSLLSKALGKMLNSVIIDGKNFKFDYEFSFQQCNVDTEVVNFNDVLKNFDFERLFGMITEEFTFAKKGRDSVTLPFADSPKFYISTNFSLRGDGDSVIGRQQIVEFTNYFNNSHTPHKEFGRMFFDDWDTEEWNKFYSYMVNCLHSYLKLGLIAFPVENYATNKFIDSYGSDVLEWLQDYILVDNEYNKKEIFQKMGLEFKNVERWKPNTFKKCIDSFCQISDLELNAHATSADGRIKRNGIEYYTFTNIKQQ
ncbi:MAG: hypothetical protein H6553_06755 [Chitinophagales bacterium]|nr:hypothetical protein [Chitinophagales bacterium]